MLDMEDGLDDNAESAGSSMGIEAADPPGHSETTKHAEEMAEEVHDVDMMDATAPGDVASLRMSQRACASHVAAGMREAIRTAETPELLELCRETRQ